MAGRNICGAELAHHMAVQSKWMAEDQTLSCTLDPHHTGRHLQPADRHAQAVGKPVFYAWNDEGYLNLI